MSAFDTIVIGAGPNGLVAATHLARAGRRVAIVEQRSSPGGLAGVDEFHAGYRAPGPLWDTRPFRPAVARALDLERHGLRFRENAPSQYALGGEAEPLALHADARRAAEEIGRRSGRDAERYVEFRAFLDRARSALAAFFDEPPLDLLEPASIGPLELLRRAMRLRNLGRRGALELLRLPPMSAADWLAEWFEDDLLQAALALPAVSGTYCGPRSPGSNLGLLLGAAEAGPGVAGGAPALVQALVAAANAAGVELLVGRRVEAVLLDGGATVGVRLDDGEQLRAPAVAASCDPQQLVLKLVPTGAASSFVERHMAGFRARGSTAQVLFAIDGRLRLRKRGDARVEIATVAGSLDEIERAFDAIKYGEMSAEPVLEIHVPTTESAELAPEGHDVASVLAHFAPHALRGGWSDEQRNTLAERVEAQLLRHLEPGGAIVARVVRTAVDLEREYLTTGGHIHHGEHALDQLLIRPTPECRGYTSPIDGLFLCGSGSHPGGGLTGLPGLFAARRMLAG
ncbi:MAG: NAD(P)/FAD-dependent oxidoreductase [bacterium]|nr:NAD(P)/FAD-dependent oxidoreductase [bacterium]